MANEWNHTRSHANPSLFSGIIYPFDFEPEYYNGRNIASRIASDWKFDERCKRNAENRDRWKGERQ